MEIWKEIIEFASFEVSNYGNIRNKRTKKIKKFQINHAGYYRVDLWQNCKKYTKRVNRLVAIAFVPNPNNLPEVNHEDGIKTNNFPSNLKWCTREYNMKHAVKTGLKKPSLGEKNGWSRFTEKDIFKMRELRMLGESLSKIANQFETSKTTISRIVNGRAWNHI